MGGKKNLFDLTRYIPFFFLKGIITILQDHTLFFIETFFFQKTSSVYKTELQSTIQMEKQNRCTEASRDKEFVKVSSYLQCFVEMQIRTMTAWFSIHLPLFKGGV